MNDFLFSDDTRKPIATEQSPEQFWDVLIVDDEETVHSITKTVLKSKVIDGKKLRFHSVYTGREATDLLREQQDFAVILLDVVMESEHAGLDACKVIRDELKLDTVRIILRTGQPGSTPEEEVILKYRINDYKEKNELTASKLFSSIVSAVRSYNDLMTIEESRKALFDEKQAIEAINAEMAAATKEIAHKASLLEKSNRYKSEFLANMSHELRTPLNSILILSSLLTENERDNLHSEQLESLNVIHKSGNELLDLIEDILALSQLETGKIKAFYQQHSPRELIKTLTEKFASIATEKGLTFSCTIADDVPVLVIIDFQKIKQVLTNLLSNAIKFTREGDVSLHINYLRSEQSLAIAVTDSGVGIEAKQVATIFESFQQIDGSTSREFGGVGLGLTIAKRMLDLIGGAITVTSELGQGSRFLVNIPLTHNITSQLHDIQPAFVQESEPLQGAQDRKQVLIVDDNSRNVFSLIQGLKSRNVKIVVAENGQAALDKLAEYPDIDIILMDIMMPVMDGNTAMKAIRASGNYNELPIIAITAKAMQEDRAQALSSGATECVAKPVDMTTLTKLMDEWLH